jgi:hypothetical protein
VLWPGFQKPA